MKTVNVAQLKAKLSRYLRAERLAAKGKCRLPTRKTSSVKISKLKREVNFLDDLHWVQGDR